MLRGCGWGEKEEEEECRGIEKREAAKKKKEKEITEITLCAQ